MNQTPDAPRHDIAPAENKFRSIVRALGIAALVLVLWFVDKFAIARLSRGSVWRYIIDGFIILVGLTTVLAFTDRLAGEKT